MWNWLVEPSAQVREPDGRRQARVFSTIILGVMATGIVLDGLYRLVVPAARFTSLLPTILVTSLLAPTYLLSRTRYYRAAGLITLAIVIGGVLVIGAGDAAAMSGGFLDYLIMAGLLGSLLLRRWQLAALIVAMAVGVSLLPLTGAPVTFSKVIIGPASFLIGTGLILILITWHRDLLEKDRQAELVEKEERYRTLVEQLPAITYLNRVDPTSPTGFRSEYVSPQFERLLGYSIEEYQRNFALWHTIVHPDDLERVRREDQEHYRTQTDSTQEYRLVARDGRVLWVQDQSRIRTDSAGRRLSQGILLDITERKLGEERVHSEAARSAALLRVAGRLNAQLDLDALLVTISEETAAALKVPVANLTLFDEAAGVLRLMGSVGLPASLGEVTLPRLQPAANPAPAGRAPVSVVANVQGHPRLPGQEYYRQFNLRSLATASLDYEGQFLGSLNAFSVGEVRKFTEEECLLLQGLADQAAVAIVNTRLYKEAHWRLERLQALRAIDVAIAGNQSLQAVLQVLLEQIAQQLSVDAAMVLLLDAHSQTLYFAASIGFRTEALQHTRLRLGDGNAGRAALERRVIAIPELATAPGSFNYAPAFAREGFEAYYAAPLIAKGQVKGVVEVFHRSRLAPDAEWLGFLEALAGQAAIAIDNSTLFDDLQRSNQELVDAYDATIVGWSHALDLRDKETEGHTQRVTDLTMSLAPVMGIEASELVHVRRGALLHDIGKMGVPDRILLKPGPLTDEERTLMQRHPTYAYEMLAPIAYLRPALDIPYCHHEMWDGTGYPRGLAGEAIPLCARVFAVVDVWDALRSDRPYRPAWPADKVVEHIRQLSGSHFDPRVVEIFLASIAAEPSS